MMYIGSKCIILTVRHTAAFMSTKMSSAIYKTKPVTYDLVTVQLVGCSTAQDE